MAKATRLPVDEVVRIDTQRLGDIIRELGEPAARSMIGLSLEQLSAGLSSLSEAALSGDMVQVERIADRLSRDAWQIGMVTLSAVAVHAADCARRDDRPAVSAVLARLHRVAAQSLREIWGKEGDADG